MDSRGFWGAGQRDGEGALAGVKEDVSEVAGAGC